MTKYVIIVLVCIVLFSSGYVIGKERTVSTKSNKEIFTVIDKYVYLPQIKIGPVSVHENMTLVEARSYYNSYRNHPIVRSFILTTYHEVCG